MTNNYLYLYYTEDLCDEKEQIEELIDDINKKLNPESTWINLIPYVLPDPHYGGKMDGNGIHLVLISQKEYPDMIREIYNPMPSSSDSPRKFVLVQKDLPGGKGIQASPQETPLRNCSFSNADTLRTYVVLLLQPYIRQITGEEVIKYWDGAIHAVGLHIADLDKLPFTANSQGLQKLRLKLNKLTGNPPLLPTTRPHLEETWRRQLLEAEVADEVQRLLHAALRIIDISRSETSSLMAQVIDTFGKGNTEKAYRFLNEHPLIPEKKERPENLGQLLNWMALKAVIRMACISTPIGKRIEEARAIFENTLRAARTSHSTCSASLMADYSAFLREHAQKADVLTMAVNALDLLWHDRGDMINHAAVTYENIAEACHATGDHAGALEHYRKALETSEQAWGKHHPAIASIHHAMAKMIIPLGYYPKALELLSKARVIREDMLGEQHPATAATYEDIGSTYHRMGDDAKALAYYSKAMEIRERTLGVIDPETATSYTNTGFVFYNQKKYRQARELFQKALAIYENTPRIHLPKTNLLYGHLADTYYNLGDYAQASEFYTRQLLAQEMMSGQEDEKTASLHSSIGNCHLLQEDYTQAAACYSKALAIREKLYGEDNDATASSYYDLGTAHACLKKYPKALEYFSKSLEIRKRVLGDKHGDTYSSCWKVALIYFKMGNFRDCVKYLEKTAKTHMAYLETDDLKAADICSCLGHAYFNLMEYQTAMNYFRKAAEIQERTLGNDHPKYKRSCFYLAKLLEYCSKGEEAVSWGRKALRAFPKNADAASTLASACLKTGRYEEAMEHYSLCLKLLHEQGASKDSIRETETIIEELKSMKTGMNRNTATS